MIACSSEKSKQLRRHLLNYNGPDVVQGMQESRIADPVGMIIEMNDDIGKQLTCAALEKQGHAEARDPRTHRIVLQECHSHLQSGRDL
jgi:hypothetical protein